MKIELTFLKKYLLIGCIWMMTTPLLAHAAVKPKIFYTDIIAGPNSGGESNNGAYLTISGNNFGDLRSGSTVTIGGGEVSEYKKWSNNKISVQLGSNVSSGDIMVSTANGTATAPEPFTVRAGDLYFVSTTGDNNTGNKNDITRPYRTANHVMGLAEFDAGDFMVIRGGNYDLSSGDEELYFESRWLNLGYGSNRSGGAVSGTSLTNAITIYGYPGETPVIDWGDLTDTTRGIMSAWDIEYYTIANLLFDLKDSGGVAIYLGFYSDPANKCDYTRLVDLTIRGGMAGATYGVNPISLQRVDYLKMYGLDIGEQSRLASPDLESHVVYLSHYYNNADIGWCYIHDNPHGRGAFKVAGDGAQSVMNMDVRIHDSIFRNLPAEAISFGIGAREIYFYNNVIDTVTTKMNGGWSPLSIRGVANNVGDYYIYHNTIYSDALDAYPGGIIQMGFSPSNQHPRSVTLKNNIIYAKSPTTNYFQINHHSFTHDKIIAERNLWFGSSEPVPAFATNALNTDPKLVNHAAGDFSLKADSPCRNVAPVTNIVKTDILGVLRSTDTLNDIGAYEFDEDAVRVSPPTNLKIY